MWRRTGEREVGTGLFGSTSPPSHDNTHSMPLTEFSQTLRQYFPSGLLIWQIATIEQAYITYRVSCVFNFWLPRLWCTHVMVRYCLFIQIIFLTLFELMLSPPFKKKNPMELIYKQHIFSWACHTKMSESKLYICCRLRISE